MSETSKFDAAKALLEKVVNDTADDLRPMVAEIEADAHPTTQYNYGRYMAVISTLSSGKESVARVIALALLRAGANRDGVSWALRLTIGGE